MRTDTLSKKINCENCWLYATAIFLMLLFLGMLAASAFTVANNFIDGYELGVKNNIICSGRDYSIRKTRKDISSFDGHRVSFKGGLTVSVLHCHWIDHYTDDYSKLKDK